MAESRTADGTPARRRSGLIQERSRQTRQRLIRAALDLWAERGFETGVEETTVEEIVHRAGVTKGTFYFHFARKEEILLEMGWDTATVVKDEARKCVKAGRSLDDSLTRVLGVLSRHVRAAPPAAVARAASEFHRAPPVSANGEHPTFNQAFVELFQQARDRGEIGTGTDPAEMGRMLEVLVMDSIFDWAAGHSDLTKALQTRATILVAGLRRPSEGRPSQGRPSLGRPSLGRPAGTRS